MDLKEALKQRRAELNLSRRAAALVIGCHYMTLESWEKGHRDPGVEWTGPLANYLQAPEHEVKEAIMRLNGWLAPEETIVITAPPSKPKRSGTKTTTGKPGRPETLIRRLQVTPEAQWRTA